MPYVSNLTKSTCVLKTWTNIDFLNSALTQSRKDLVDGLQIHHTSLLKMLRSRAFRNLNSNLFSYTLRQSLTPGLALRIQVRLLSNAHNPMCLPFAQTLVVRRSSMVHTPIIADRQIIGILPLISGLQIMILDNQPQKPFQQSFRLIWCDVVDLLHMLSDCEDGFPSGDRIGADDGVRGFETIADVVGRAARGNVQFEVIVFGSFIKQRLRKGGSKGF